MKFVLSIILLLFTALTTTLPAHTFAQGSFATFTTVKVNQQSGQQSNKQQVPVKNATQAAQIAQRRFGGKVLKVFKVQAKKTGYRVKLIKKNGHIIVVFVDGKTGRISGQQ